MQTLKHFTILSLIVLFTLSCQDSAMTGVDDNGENDNGEFSFNHERSPGASAIDYLTQDNFENLVVEIQYMEGVEPESSALENLRGFLNERLHKSNITLLEPAEIPAAGQSSYSAADVRDLEREYRTEFTNENQLTAYLIILDGEFENANVLGIAHFNTSMALFGETIRSVSGGLGQPSRSVIETTVLLHEMGHLIGLVNNGVEMQENHQDEAHGNHCDVDSCLMYHQVNTADFFANLFGGSIPELDDFCLADLQAAGGR